MLWEMYQDVVQLEIPMHYVLLVECLAPGYDLLQAADGKLLREAAMMVEKVLHAAPVSELENGVEVRLGLDHLHLLDDVRTVDHLQEDELAAQTQHPLLPVLGVAPSRLIYPVMRCNLASVMLFVHLKEPDGGLDPLAQLFVKDVVLLGEFQALNRFQIDPLGDGYTCVSVGLAAFGGGLFHGRCQSLCVPVSRRGVLFLLNIA